MPLKRTLILIGIIILLGLFLWATVNIGKEVEIANFTTDISRRNEEQIENIKIALVKIDGTILNTGDIFSFNELVGERLQKLGFKGAPTIYNGRVVDTPGGGICQLSSTIYNSALLSGMEIIERQPHLWTVRSVGPGRDAAVLYDKIDLKFRNNLPLPVKIKGEVTENRLIIRFFAPQKLNRSIKITTEILQVYKAYTVTNTGEKIPEHSQERDGVKVKVLRITTEEGKPETKEVISIDTYKPIPDVR